MAASGIRAAADTGESGQPLMRNSGEKSGRRRAREIEGIDATLGKTAGTYSLSGSAALSVPESRCKTRQIPWQLIGAGHERTPSVSVALDRLTSAELERAFSSARAHLEQRTQLWDWEEEVDLIGVAKVAFPPLPRSSLVPVALNEPEQSYFSAPHPRRFISACGDAFLPSPFDFQLSTFNSIPRCQFDRRFRPGPETDTPPSPGKQTIYQ